MNSANTPHLFKETIKLIPLMSRELNLMNAFQQVFRVNPIRLGSKDYIYIK